MKATKQGVYSKKKKSLLRCSFFIGIILFLIDFVVLFFLKNYLNLSAFSNLMNITISLAVVLMSFFYYHYIPKKSASEKNFFLFLSIAFFFKFLGEVLWAYYDLSAITMPPFSFADLAWFLSNLTILAGFEYKLNKTKLPHKKLTVTIFTVVLMVLSAFFIYGVYLRLLDLETGAWFSYLVNESYVLFDLFILTLLMTPLYNSITYSDKSFKFYFFIALGFVSFIVYDFLFAEMFLKNTYSSAGIIEVLYFFSYLLLYYAYYFKFKNGNSLKK
jgi:hypothetical protein